MSQTENKHGFIYETLNDVKTLQVEKTDDGLMKLTGIFGVCGVRNNNQRVYETKNYKAMIDEMSKRIQEEGCPGELEHPNTMNITLDNISHKINKIEIDKNGVVTGEITLLNTPKGKIAQEIIKGGLPLYISSRAQGNVDKYGNVTLEMLKTYDLVGSPGFSQAKLQLSESQKSLCESLSEDSHIFFIPENVEAPANPTETQTNETIENKDQNNMDENQILEQYKSIVEELKEQVECLQSQVAYLEEKQNMQPIQENQQIDVKSLADGIQNWAINEFAPEIEKWCVEHFAPEIEKWVIEQYSPEVEKWITKEYSPVVEKWCVEHFAPEIEKWVIEQYSPEVEKWCVEEFGKGIQDWFESRQIQESTQSKDKTLSHIDDVLSLLESQVGKKPTYKRIVENTEEPMFIAEMPEDSRVKWNMADDQVKESIKRRAKIFNFNRENAIQEFWESVDWNMQITPITESVDNLDVRRQRLRAWMNR